MLKLRGMMFFLLTGLTKREGESLYPWNVMKCITVEIEIEKSKNIIINCVYTQHQDPALIHFGIS